MLRDFSQRILDPEGCGGVLPALPDYYRVYRVYLRPVVVVGVQNIRASDRDVLARVRNWDLVCIVLACWYRICLARWVYADYLDHQITVLGVPWLPLFVRLL